MNTNEKPTFGVVTDQTTNTNITELVKQRSTRQEIGASWSKVSKTGMNYYTTKLTLTKQKLQELLDSATGDVVELRLVSFPNSNRDNNPRRPTLRVYEEINNV